VVPGSRLQGCQSGALVGPAGPDGSGHGQHQPGGGQHAAEIEPERAVVLTEEERQYGRCREQQPDREQGEAQAHQGRPRSRWRHLFSISGAGGCGLAISCDIDVRTACGRQLFVTTIKICFDTSNGVFSHAVRQGEVV
jgi:hypothetical protein